jgi:hypothetical protein
MGWLPAALTAVLAVLGCGVVNTWSRCFPAPSLTSPPVRPPVPSKANPAAPSSDVIPSRQLYADSRQMLAALAALAFADIDRRRSPEMPWCG